MFAKISLNYFLDLFYCLVGGEEGKESQNPPVFHSYLKNYEVFFYKSFQMEKFPSSDHHGVNLKASYVGFFMKKVCRIFIFRYFNFFGIHFGKPINFLLNVKYNKIKIEFMHNN